MLIENRNRSGSLANQSLSPVGEGDSFRLVGCNRPR